MRVVVVGATGNAGSSLVRLLSADERISAVVGIARRRPRLVLPKTVWEQADIGVDDLAPLLEGADAVVHLAWLIQPSHDLAALRRTNIDGTERLLQATARAGVRSLVYASSVGAYSPGVKDKLVDENWPLEGVRGSFYSRHKAEVERRLDVFERAYPDVRVVRLRPGLIFKREAATGIRRLFAGPLLPRSLLHPRFVPFLPALPGLRFQAVHADDVAEAYLQAITLGVRGAFNIAADPVLDSRRLAELFGARPIPVPRSLARAAVSVLWHLHVQPTPPGWLDLALSAPLLDSTRARTELHWAPSYTAEQALQELLIGLRTGAGDDTPPLSPETSGPARSREFASGIGSRGGGDTASTPPGGHVTQALQGEWRLVRTSGLLPPLGGMRKHIERDRGWTIAGPIELPFEVAGLELRYRPPLLGLVDVLDPEGPDVYGGTAMLFGRRVGTFRMTRTA